MKSKQKQKMDFIIDLEKIENGQIKDRALRNMISYGLTSILVEKERDDIETQNDKLLKFIRELKQSPIAIQAHKANEQHYEVSVDFFQLVLGKRLKYSSCYYPEEVSSLEQAEEAMLQLICDRAQIEDGHKILDLGCGWGALSLYIAEKYPNCQITGLSNSHGQKDFITAQKAFYSVDNLQIITADIAEFDLAEKFDRIISIEMFEHMRNYEQLLAKVAGWLKPDGLLFVHIFTHVKYAYYLENNWIAEHFFTGGIMPSDNLLLYFAEDVSIQNHWKINGLHYKKTCEAWLNNLDRNKPQALDIISKIYGKNRAKKVFIMWRLFFLTCAESFGYNNGREWIVSHYLFSRKQ